MKALLLDFDRTLVDVQTYTDYEAAVRDLDEHLGGIDLVEVPDTGWASATKRCMAVLVSLAGDPERWSEADRLISARELAATSAAKAMPGLDSFLEATAEFPRAIVTLMGREPLDTACERFDIDVAIRVPRRRGLVPKPAPDQIIDACHRLGVDPVRAVMVGDSTWDQRAAVAAGAEFIGVTNGTPSEFPPATTVAADLLDVLGFLGT